MIPHNNGTVTDPIQAAAYSYLKRGYRSIPIPRIGNHKGVVLDGWPDIRINEEQIPQFFPPDPPQNIGILLGEASAGLVDIDLDCAEALLAAPFLLPKTGMISGRPSAPRSHWWYVVDHPPKKASDKFHDLDSRQTCLLEFRSTRGQTVVPPSIHEFGELIEWYTFQEPTQLSTLELYRSVRKLAAVTLLARHWVQQGIRQDAFMALIGGLLRCEWTPKEVEPFVRALGAATHDEEIEKRVQAIESSANKIQQDQPATGWPRLEKLLGDTGKVIVRTVRQWLGGQNPSAEMATQPVELATLSPWGAPIPFGEEPPVPAFPLEVLPRRLQEYAQEAAWALNAPVDFLGVTMIGLAAGAIGNTYRLRITEIHQQPALIYLAMIGLPASGKSPALKLLTRPFDLLQTQMNKRYEDELEAWDELESTDRGPRPQLQVCIARNVTTESLTLLHFYNRRGFAMPIDELSGLFDGLNQYKGGRGNDRQTYLAIWAQETIDAKRKKDLTDGRPPVFVPNPCISIVGGIQPDLLTSIRGERIRGITPPDDGGLDRFLFSWPVALPEIGEQWRDIHPDRRPLWEKVVRKLFCELDGDGHLVSLTQEAKAEWERFTQAQAAEINREDFIPALRGPWIKLKAYQARCALVLHLLRWACGEPVSLTLLDGESMRAASRLIEYFKGHARKVHVVIGTDSRIIPGRKLLRWIRQEQLSRFSKRDAYQKLKGGLKTVDALEPILTLMEQHQLIRPEPIEDPLRRGRKSSPWYEVNPELLLEAHNSHNSHNSPPDDNCGNCGNCEEGVGGKEELSELSSTKGEIAENQPFRSNSGNCGNCEEGVGGVENPSEGNAEEESKSPNQHLESNCGNCGNWERECEEEKQPNQSSKSAEELTNSVTVEPACPIKTVQKTDTSSLGSPEKSSSTCDHNSHNSHNSISEVTYTRIDRTDDLPMVLQAIDDSEIVALDLETTGLDAKVDQIRLVSLNTGVSDDQRCTYLVDCSKVDPTPLWEVLQEKPLVVHNAAFDLAFLRQVGFEPHQIVHDTMILDQLLTAGTKTSSKLVDVTQRYLDYSLDKTQQTSDWSGELTEEQLRYAAKDVEVLLPLFRKLTEAIRLARLEKVAGIELSCLPTMVWMSAQGVAFDRRRWESLTQKAHQEAEAFKTQLDSMAPKRSEELFESTWNWDSPAQVKEAFSLLGITLESTSDESLAGIEHPLANILRQYRYAQKRTSTYGNDWLKHVSDDGRVYPSWWQLGAASGRMSCSQPNMQQLPRGEYRQSIVASEGRVLVKADYSQIELRIAAKISNDRALREAYEEGEDLHTITARNVLGKTEVTQADRQLAKAINFGLLYGMGARGFRQYAKTQYEVDLTESQAKEYRSTFFHTYPGLAQWHRKVKSRKTTETRTLAGRRRLLEANATDTKRLNTPVQGTGADGLKQALGLLWQRRDQVPGAFPVLVVHDEIVVECDANQADQVSQWLRQSMIDGMAPLIDPIPLVVEVKVASSWGG